MGSECSYNPQTQTKQEGGIQKKVDLLKCIVIELTKTVKNLDSEIKELKKRKNKYFRSCIWYHKIVHH